MVQQPAHNNKIGRQPAFLHPEQLQMQILGKGSSHISSQSLDGVAHLIRKAAGLSMNPGAIPRLTVEAGASGQSPASRSALLHGQKVPVQLHLHPQALVILQQRLLRFCLTNSINCLSRLWLNHVRTRFWYWSNYCYVSCSSFVRVWC